MGHLCSPAAGNFHPHMGNTQNTLSQLCEHPGCPLQTNEGFPRELCSPTWRVPFQGHSIQSPAHSEKSQPRAVPHPLGTPPLVTPAAAWLQPAPHLISHSGRPGHPPGWLTGALGFRHSSPRRHCHHQTRTKKEREKERSSSD